MRLLFPKRAVSLLFRDWTPADYVGGHLLVRVKVAPPVIETTSGHYLRHDALKGGSLIARIKLAQFLAKTLDNHLLF